MIARKLASVRSLAFFGGIALASIAVCAADAVQSPDDTLSYFAATVNHTPMQSWGPGAGIYLGHGLVLTAAHVAGRTWLTRPKVILGGQEFSTSTVKAGSFEDVDLTLLSFDDSTLPLRYRLRQNSICNFAPWPGEQVVTVVPGKIVPSHVMSPRLLPVASQRYRTVISDVRDTGNSGSGVFDERYQCLLGIMSRKISKQVAIPWIEKPVWIDVAKFFVPASSIAGFLPEQYKIPRIPAR